MEEALQDLEVYKRMYYKNNPESTKEEEINAVKKKAAEIIQVCANHFVLFHKKG